jgi:hypothetical protein
LSNHFSKKELESYLSGAATPLRGLVASDYKQYIFPLLFFTRLSDVWDEDCREAFAGTGDEGHATATANVRFTIPDGAHWKDVRLAPRDVGRALLTAFQAHRVRKPAAAAGRFWHQTRSLMREAGVWVRYRRRYRATTNSNHRQPLFENCMERNFTVDTPDHVYAGDITYVWTAPDQHVVL